jgi:hypothetical protein
VAQFGISLRPLLLESVDSAQKEQQPLTAEFAEKGRRGREEIQTQAATFNSGALKPFDPPV